MSLLPVAEAQALVLALAPPVRTEEVAIDAAQGRVLACPAVSRLTQPPFDAAAMDGYAVRAADLPGTLDVVGISAAGRPHVGPVGPGQAVRIFTGAPVPDGADRVAMQEDCARDGDRVSIATATTRDHIRRRGTDFAEGDAVAPGRVLRPAAIALLAAMNVPQVTVALRPRVAVLAGGDELVRPGTVPGPGQIVSSNDLAIAAMVREAGGIPTILPLASDDRDALRERFAQAQDHDLLVTIGGASVGDHDLIAGVAAEMGMARSFHRIAMRPGKPLMAGRMGTTAMLGLPGNPVSAMVCGTLFLQPLLRAMQGAAQPLPQLRRAALAIGLPPEGDRAHYLRAVMDEATSTISPFEDQDSARLTIMAQANALLIRPPHDPARRVGEEMSFIGLTD